MNYSIANDICQIVFVQFILLILDYSRISRESG